MTSLVPKITIISLRHNQETERRSKSSYSKTTVKEINIMGITDFLKAPFLGGGLLLVFLPFLGPLPQHMEVLRLGVESEL